MRTITTLTRFLLVAAASAATVAPPVAQPQAEPRDTLCGPAGRAHVRTTLYFGLTRPAGTVSERDWRTFVRREVTPRFPDGLTIWEAEGQYRHADGRIGRERSKVLLLVHDDTPRARATLGDLVATYKRLFEQESVLWESAMVCATF